MRNQYAKQLLAGIMCVSLIFQSGSVTSLAAETTVQEESLKDTETAVEESLTEHEKIIQEGSNKIDTKESDAEDKAEDNSVLETGISNTNETEIPQTERNQETEKAPIKEDAETQEISVTENSGTQDALETESSGIQDASTTEDLKTQETENHTEAQDPETTETTEKSDTTDTIDTTTPEESTAADLTETEEIEITEIIENAETDQTTTEENTDEDETATTGEFQNISVVFDGYLAVINAEYILASNAANASFCVVSYDKDGAEIASDYIYSSQEEDSTNIYTISGQTAKLYNDVVSIKIQSTEYDVSGNALENPVYSNAFIREQIPEIQFSVGECKIGAGSITVPYYFDGNMYRPEGREGNDFYVDVQLKYWLDNIDEYNATSSGSWFTAVNNEELTITGNGLLEETTYHAQLLLSISGTDAERGNIYEQTIALPDFTTPKDTTYDLEQEFPDEVFREMIRNELSLDEAETTIKESQLVRIVYLNKSRSDITTPAVKNIKGLELLCNVENIDLGGHEISDINNIEWEKLTELRTLNLQGNCIESVPDFTKNTKLSNIYLTYNFLSSEELPNIENKLPEGCYCDYTLRRKDFTFIMEDKYYQTNGKSEVLLRIQGYNPYFSHQYKVYIDDSLVEMERTSNRDNEGYEYLILYNYDIPYEIGTHTLKFELYEGTSNELIVTKERNFEIIEQKTLLMDRSDSSKTADIYYMSAQEVDLSVMTYGTKEVTDIYLVKEGLIYGKNDWISSSGSDTYINKYPQLGNHSSYGFYYSTSANIYINKQQLASGTYDLKLVFQDKTEEILEGTIEVISSAVIKYVSAGSSYDHTGEYLYLALDADYLDPAKINYTIKNSDNYRTLQTEYVDCKPIYNGYVVKLKKIGWDSGITAIRVYFSGKEDYPLYVASSYNYCNIENMLYFSDYNYQSNMLEVGITAQSNIEDYIYSIVRTDLPWDFSTEHIQEEYTVRLEEVEDTIYNVIPKWEGEECTLYGGYYRFSILRSEEADPIRTYDFHIPGLVVERSKRLTDNGYWGNESYNLVQQGIGKVTRSYYSEIVYVEGNAEDFSAQITGELLESPLDAQRIYTWNYSSDVYKTGIDMEFDYSVLELGNYTIELYYRNSLLAEYEIQVIPNDIFVLYDYTYAQWNWDDTFHVNFYTPNCGESDDYTVLVTDINGKEIEGLTVTNSYKYASSSYVNFNIEGLKKSEADRYYYFKLLHKTKGDALCEDLETKYYRNAYGKYTRLYNNSKYGWNSLYVDGVRKGITGIWQEDTTIFPATFTIYKFNDTKSYYSKVLTEEDFDNRNFYFTQEIIDALPRANGYYDLVLIGNEGQFLNETRVQISLDTDVLNAFRVVPSSMTLKLNVEEESSKIITAFNSTEIPTFESDDTTIADVTVSTDDPNVATVEAVGVGRTSITVISGSNIKKVIVEVTETPIDAEKIQFTEESIKAVQGTKVFANVKVTPENAWISSSRISYTSSDENIVSVGDSTTRNITLIANNAGTATITATLEGTALTAQCTVTVLAGYTEEEKAQLAAAIGDLYFLEGAEQILADIKLPEGWRWSNPSQKPTADSNRPIKEFSAIYAKDGLDFFTMPLSVHITNVSTKIAGAAELSLLTIETYKFMFEFTGYKPADNTTYAASFQWVGSDNLKIQGKDNQGEVTVQAGKTPGTYPLLGTIYLKNTKTGNELVQTLKYDVAVKDNTDAINAEIMKKTFYFLEGADTSLKDIIIGNGWSWAQPDTVPQADASLPVQTFAAKYNAEGRQPIQARLSVAVAALESVNISGAAKIAAEKTGSYRLRYQFTGGNINNSDGYEISYQWKGDKGITITGADNAESVTVKTGSTPGSYTLTAEVTVKNCQTGNTTTAEGNYVIQILDKDSIDNIIIKPANQQPERALPCVINNGALECDYAAFDKRASYKIQLTADMTASGIAKNTSVQWESSDDKVAVIDSAGLVAVKKAGVTVISATATDKGGYTEEILLKIQDFMPVMDKKALTVYQYSSMGAELGLTAQSSNQIQSVTVSGASGLQAAEVSGIWYLKAKGYSKKTFENVVLKITADKGTYEMPLKVTVNVTQPKATIKQTVKPNIFYTDAKAVFKVTAKETITQITDASGASETCFHVKDYDAQAGLLTLEPRNLSENIERYKEKNTEALKAKVKITFAGYTEPIETTVKVSVQNKKPSLRIDPASFIKDTGMDEVLTIVRNGKTVYYLNDAVVESKTENVGASVFNGKLRLNYSGTSKASYKVDIQDAHWTQAVTVAGKIQMINADALALQAETQKITINKANLSTVVIPVAVKGNSGLEPDINLTYDSAAMMVSYQDGVVTIQVLESAQDKTYKIEVGGTIEAAGRTFDIKKAVIKVTVTSKEASVKLFASGKINIADRKYSATTYTPTLRNMDANIVGAEVTGDLSEYFYAYLDESEKVVLKAVSGKPLKANQKYTVEIATFFDNGYQTVTKVNIKPIHKLPKVKASLSQGTLYKANADSRINIQLTVDARYNITQVRLAENTNSEYFALTCSESGLITVTLSENGMKIPSGTYTVPYQILIADADNTKPITQNIKITVK